MKKKLTISLIMFSITSLLCGFDNTETAENILQNAWNSCSSATDITVDMHMNTAVAVEFGETDSLSTLRIAGNNILNTSIKTDPFALALEISSSTSILGMNQNSEMKIYGIANEKGDIELYSGFSEAENEYEWKYSSIKNDVVRELVSGFEQLWDSVSNNVSDFSYSLTPEAVFVNDAECYEIILSLDSDQIYQLISAFLDKASELDGTDSSAYESFLMLFEYLEGFQYNLTFYVNTTDFSPVSICLDTNGSDLTNFSSLFQLIMNMEMETEDIYFNIASFDNLYDASISFDKLEEISIPQEAIDAISVNETEADM